MKNYRIIKIILMALLFITGITSCNNQSSRKKGAIVKEKRMEKSGFVLQFEEDEYSFGTVDATKKENEYIRKKFVFVNNNDKPLIIAKADVSCGCVSTKIPEKPILKGEKGIITVTVDTKQLNGIFSKNVYVKSNAENDVELLRVTGEVKNK